MHSLHLIITACSSGHTDNYLAPRSVRHDPIVRVQHVLELVNRVDDWDDSPCRYEGGEVRWRAVPGTQTESSHLWQSTRSRLASGACRFYTAPYYVPIEE